MCDGRTARALLKRRLVTVLVSRHFDFLIFSERRSFSGFGEFGEVRIRCGLFCTWAMDSRVLPRLYVKLDSRDWDPISASIKTLMAAF